MNQENQHLEETRVSPDTAFTNEENDRPVRMFRRPSTVDETDRLGRELVRRLLEAGVTEG